MTDETEEQHDYDGPERRDPAISVELQEKIARRAADIAWEQLQLAVGKSTLKAVAYIIGAAVVVLAGYLGIQGHLK